MPKKRQTVEQNIAKLREAEVVLAQGATVAEACRSLGVTEQTYYRWCKEYGGLWLDQARRLKEIERENMRLRRRRRGSPRTSTSPRRCSIARKRASV